MVMNLKHALKGAAIAAVALVSATGANAALIRNFTAADLNISTGPMGSITAGFTQTGISEAGQATTDFTDTYTFRIPANGFGSGSVITTASFLGASDDTDIISVVVNGITATKSDTGINEFAFVNNVPIIADAFNTIVVTGLARGNGSYSGTATFTPAVPEPASWALMIMGVGVAGGATRYRRRSAAKVSFA
jgi:hypothetical protein